MFRSVSLCCCLAIVASTTPLVAQTIPPGWVDYTGGVWSYWESSLNNGTSAQIPFTFDFYGEEHTTTRIFFQSNGYLGPGPNLFNSDDPTEDWPFSSGGWEGSRRMIAPLWHDFQPSWFYPGYVYYGTVGEGSQRRFVATWDTHTAINQRNIFQAQLHEGTNNISFHYYLLTGPEAGSRVGINMGDGVEYTGFWYDGAENFDGDGTQNANQRGPAGSLEGTTITYSFDADTGSYVATHTAVPAPGALIMTLIGLGGGVAAIRRRRASRDQPAE